MTIPLFTVVPSTNDPTNFAAEADQCLSEWNTVIQAQNEAIAALTSIAAGTAFAIPYTFSTTTADADPGAGTLRLDNATQNLATTMRADLLGADGATWTGVLDAFDDSSSAVKGQIVLVKLDDATKWLAFNATALESPSGYRNITVVNVASSAANPFADGDSLALKFTRTGDVGTAGTVTRRVSTITSSATPTPNATTDDMFIITALATAPTFAAPTGSPSDGQGLLIRVKDNGTARALAFNAIYRASTDLALPSTTVISKTLYMGFVFNSADTKWDLVAVLSNFT